MRRNPVLVSLLVLALTPLALGQKYSSGEEVMDAVEAQQSPSTIVATMTMTITSRSGQSLTREMRIWSAEEGTKQLIKFTAPADIRGSGFLSIETASGASESMIYLPALDRVRRIAGGQQQEAFFGSDFSYEDVTALGGDFGEDYAFELLETREGPLYVVEATPKEGADTPYDRLVLEVTEETLVPTRVEFYRNAELFKVMTLSETSEVAGYTLPSQIRMETVASGSFTTIEQSDWTVDEEIPDDVFSERFLRR